MDANEYAQKVTPAAKSLELALRRAVWLGGGTTPASSGAVPASEGIAGQASTPALVASSVGSAAGAAASATLAGARAAGAVTLATLAVAASMPVPAAAEVAKVTAVPEEAAAKEKAAAKGKRRGGGASTGGHGLAPELPPAGASLVAGGGTDDPAPASPRPPSPAAPRGSALAPAVSPLVAAFSSTAAELPAPSPAPLASPVPPVSLLPALAPAASPLPAEVKPEEVMIRLGDRRYRVRGLAKNLSYESLKINLLAGRGESFHVDTLDLYSARQRASFIQQAAGELGVEPEVVKRDLGQVLLQLEQLQDAQIQSALHPVAKEVTMSAEERAAALELLSSPDLLGRILADFALCGVVGEETNKLVGYLAAVSRKLDEPLAVIVQSSTAAGKSALMEAVLSLVPEEERVQYSAMTGQSLFYMGETDLRHKILAIVEEEGAERASYALKLLQSEGELTIASTGKDPATGKLTTHEYRVEGPVMIFLTTTAIDLDEELLNRCLVLTVDEEREQTRAIHRAQRTAQTLAGLLAREERKAIERLHRNAQRLLRPLAVANPYAPGLTFLDSQTRTRRDHMKYLTLIRAIALLYQHQRPVRKAELHGQTIEYLEVEPSDIAVANRLTAEVLGRSLDELPPQTRRMLGQLDGMVREACERLAIARADYRFSRREVRAYSGWSYEQVRVHLDRLVALEYLVVHHGGRGQSFVYELLYEGGGEDGRPVLLGLLDPSALPAGGTTESLGGPEGGFGVVAGSLWGAIPAPYRGHTGPYRSEENVALVGVSGGFSAKSPKNAHLDPEENPSSYPGSHRSNGSAPAAVGSR